MSKATERNGLSEAKYTPESAVPCSKRPGVRRKLPGDLSLRALSAAEGTDSCPPIYFGLEVEWFMLKAQVMMLT